MEGKCAFRGVVGAKDKMFIENLKHLDHKICKKLKLLKRLNKFLNINKVARSAIIMNH